MARGDLDIAKLGGEEEKKKHEELAGGMTCLVQKLKEVLAEQAKDVRITSRLTSSPCCLVADETDMGGNLARILKAAGQKVPESKPILEINPEHALVQRLRDELGDGAAMPPRFGDWAHVLFDQALLAEGGSLEDPAGFVKRLNELMLELAGAKSKIWTPGT